MKNYLQQTIEEIDRFQGKSTKAGAVMLRKQLMGLTKLAKDLRAEVLKDSKALTKSKPAREARPKSEPAERKKKATSKKASLREQEPKKKTIKEVMTELAEDASRL